MNKHQLICLGAGLVLIGLGVFRLWRRSEQKKRCSARVDGRVLDVYSSAKGSDSEAKTSLFAKYEYWAQDKRIEKKVSLTDKQFKALKAGQKLTVFYDPAKPKRCYVAQIKSSQLLALMLIGLGLVSALAGFTILA